MLCIRLITQAVKATLAWLEEMALTAVIVVSILGAFVALSKIIK